MMVLALPGIPTDSDDNHIAEPAPALVATPALSAASLAVDGKVVHESPKEVSPSIEIHHRSYWSGLRRFWFGLIFVGDLPSSSIPGSSVRTQMSEAFSASLSLTVIAMIFTLAIGLALAVLINRVHNHQAIVIAMNLILASPIFFLAPIMIFLFTVYIPLFPGAFLSSAKSYVLPTIVLSMRPSVVIAHLLCTSFAKLRTSDFVRAARARGVPELTIFLKHILRNSLISVLAILPHQVYHLIVSSILVELLFAIPGTGSLLVSALAHRDANLIAAEIVFLAVILFIVSEISDQLARIADPRIQIQRANL